jgi:hypothetical protein
LLFAQVLLYFSKAHKFLKAVNRFVEAEMNIEEIRQVVKRKPFKPFIFSLDNGEKHAVRHPEIIVTNELIMTVNDLGRAVLIAPEAVTSIEYMEAEFTFAEPATDKP